MGRPQRWPECDDDIRRFAKGLMELFIEELGRQLIGIYLHGSLAMGSYYRPKSDIDLLVVVQDQLDPSLPAKVQRHERFKARFFKGPDCQQLIDLN